MAEHGQCVRPGRGLYRLPGLDYQTPCYEFAEFQKRIPNIFTCLLSAPAYHEMTTQLLHEIWIAIGKRDRRPKPDQIPFDVVRFSHEAISEGIQEYIIEKVPVKITNPARTVAACFK